MYSINDIHNYIQSRLYEGLYNMQYTNKEEKEFKEKRKSMLGVYHRPIDISQMDRQKKDKNIDNVLHDQVASHMKPVPKHIIV